MRRLLLLVVPVTILGAVAACGGGDDAQSASGESASTSTASPSTAVSSTVDDADTTDTTTAAARRGPAFVEGVRTSVGADRGVTVAINGQVPTPCHRPGLQTGTTAIDGRITVEVFSVPPAPDELCAQVLTPFTDQVRLGPLEPGSYVVAVNGVDYPVAVS